jgi:hypothetical protein
MINMQMNKVEFLFSEVPPSADAVVISINDEGELSLHSTLTKGPDILWALELAKTHVLEMGQPEDA